MTNQTNQYQPLMQSVYIHERSWVGVQENLKNNDVVLIPVGAVEQHGAHTPHMVDMCWATAISEGVAEKTGAIVAPPVYCAYSSGHMAYPGSITIRPSVITDYIVDIAASLALYGYKRFILVNGNRVANLPPMMDAARKIRVKFGAYSTCIDSGLMTLEETADMVEMPGGLEHAGDAETSFMLHYRPDLVDMNLASGDQPECPDPEMEAYCAGAYTLVNPLLSKFMLPGPKPMGTSAAASAQKGKQILDLMVDRSAAFVEKIRAEKVELRNLEIPA